MSYFDDQHQAWINNGCEGDIEDYDTLDIIEVEDLDIPIDQDIEVEPESDDLV